VPPLAKLTSCTLNISKSQWPRALEIRIYPRSDVIIFLLLFSFYGEKLLTLQQRPKMEDHPLSAIRATSKGRSQLISIFGCCLFHMQSDDAERRGDELVVWFTLVPFCDTI
jgi:hypothetical protein